MHLQINDIIAEFRHKVSQLRTTSSFNEYEFIKKSIIPKIEKVCKMQNNKVKVVIAKYYLSIVKDRIHTMDDLKLTQSPVAITKISPECNESMTSYGPFIRYMKLTHILMNKMLMISEYK